jgi:undecaprenyl-diphosphatase
MTIFHSIVLGIVEGVTEFLPISSTGHLILSAELLNIAHTSFVKSFEIIIQLGAILAVVVMYFQKLWQWDTIKKVFVAFIPTSIVGLVFYKFIKTYLVGNTTVVLWALFLGGLALIIFEKLFSKKQKEQNISETNIETISYKQAFLIGIFQSLAVVPGVSRSAATIVGGLSLGLSRTIIVEFSFLLAIPTMLAATGLDLIKSQSLFTSREFGLLAIGFVVSFFVAMVSIKFLLRYIKHHSFTSFGIYRIIVAILFWLIVLK